jgi:hypothetical protein
VFFVARARVIHCKAKQARRLGAAAAFRLG